VLVEYSQFYELYHELKSIVHKSADAATSLGLSWQQYMWSLLTGILWWPYNLVTSKRILGLGWVS